MVSRDHAPATGAKLADLLERIEKATGPDREIDKAINRVIGRDNRFHQDAGYTRSLDAALALVERLQGPATYHLMMEAVTNWQHDRASSVSALPRYLLAALLTAIIAANADTSARPPHARED